MFGSEHLITRPISGCCNWLIHHQGEAIDSAIVGLCPVYHKGNRKHYCIALCQHITTITVQPILSALHNGKNEVSLTALATDTDDYIGLMLVSRGNLPFVKIYTYLWALWIVKLQDKYQNSSHLGSDTWWWCSDRNGGGHDIRIYGRNRTCNLTLRSWTKGLPLIYTWFALGPLLDLLMRATALTRYR